MPTRPWTPEEATQELLSVLPFLNRMIAAELRREAGEDATMIQFRVLSHLAECPLTLSALAKKRRVSLQSAGELVQSLVARGWIVRTPDPADRRQALLHLSDEGRTRYEHAEQRMVNHLAPLLSKLTGQEMKAIQVALPALHRVLSGDDDEVDSEV
jgi:DNA-binding MarR family transcriptional regulator